MKDFFKRSANFGRIEFWVITTIWVFVVFFFVSEGLDGDPFDKHSPFANLFRKAHVPFDYYDHFFIPQLIRYIFLYVAFIVANFVIVPRIIARRNVMVDGLLLVLVFIATVLVFGVTETYLRGYRYTSPYRDPVHRALFRDAFAYCLRFLMMMAVYSFIKYVGIYLLYRSAELERNYRFIRREGIVAFVIWLIGLMFLLAAGADRFVVMTWFATVPTGIMIYLAGFYSLIRQASRRKYPFLYFLLVNAVILVVTFFSMLVLLFMIAEHGNDAPAVSLFSCLMNFFFTVPFTWIVYRRVMKGNEQINDLKKELGQSNASFDFLRSQINPHFLFNALNTIYGTAIQEKAERTGSAVLKLSDMMRFMLQENMQETIPLVRELEYLENYIALQQLRIADNPELRIQVSIEPTVLPVRVAPMLFIPFVENAFKHGISFREPSYISIALQVKDGIIHFDVHNSTHRKTAGDPEAGRSGIGLNNVRQRLELLYPGSHELVIRETAHDFFVHLTIESV